MSSISDYEKALVSYLTQALESEVGVRLKTDQPLRLGNIIRNLRHRLRESGFTRFNDLHIRTVTRSNEVWIIRSSNSEQPSESKDQPSAV